MSKRQGGPTIDRGPEPAKERDDVGGVAGTSGRRGDDPSPDERDRGELGSSDDPAPVDLDSAHDRAS